MKIEVGKKYRRRDGEVVEIVDNTPANHPCVRDYPFIARDDGHTYTPNGQYSAFEVHSELDLVEEIIDEQAAVAVDPLLRLMTASETVVVERPFPPARYQELNGSEKAGNSYGEIIRQEQLKDRATELAEAATPRPDVQAIIEIDRIMRDLPRQYQRFVMGWLAERTKQ